MAAPVELHCCRKSRGTASDHRDFLSGVYGGNFRLHPSLGEGFLNDRPLIFFCRYRLPVQVAGTRRFAERRADPAGELRKAVGGFQAFVRLLPVARVNQIVRLRHQIVQGASADHSGEHSARLTEGNAARHTSGSLKSLLFQRQGRAELLKVLNSLKRRLYPCRLSFVFQKSCWLSHVNSSYLFCSMAS